MSVGKWAVSAFIAFHCLMLVVENSKPNSLYDANGNVFAIYASMIGQNQVWDMFTGAPVRPASLRLEAVDGAERRSLALTWPETHETPHVKEVTFFLNLLQRRWNAATMAYFDGAVGGLLDRGERADRLELTYRGRGVMSVDDLAPDDPVVVPTERKLTLTLVRVDRGVPTPLPTVLADDASIRDAMRARGGAPGHSPNLSVLLMRGARTACGAYPPADRIELQIGRSGDDQGSTLAGVVSCHK